MQKILLLDSTLREGQQAPKVRFSHDQALQMARELDAFGVDFIETSPIVSEKTMHCTREMIAENLKAKIVLHGRAMESDIDALLKFDPEWIAIFLSTSDIHLEHKLHSTRGEAEERAVKAIEYAKAHGLKLRFTCEDSTRTDKNYLIKMAKLAHETGADRVSITDTVGIMTPSSMHTLVRDVVEAVPGIQLDVHCHNDLGLALANALAAVEGGANCIHASVNGAGERAGIPKLAETAMALQVLYGQRMDFDVSRLPRLSKMFSDYTHLPSDPFNPIVGENVFRHKGGTHLSAVLKSDGKAYEAFTPESIGRRRQFVVGEYSGKNVLKYLSSSLNLKLTDAQVQKAMQRLKEKDGDLFEFEL